MAEYNSFAYECSRNNASIQLDEAGTEWINEFSEGIELNVGDQVRVLGSFVNESATGQNIEITEDNNETNITFSPYIKGTTFSTSDVSDDLMKLGDYAEPAYSTDSFGIEPPMAMLLNTGSFKAPYPATGPYLRSLQTGGTTIIDDPFNTYFSRDDEVWYGDPNATGTDDTVINRGSTNAIQWRGQKQAAETWGTNMITSQNSQNEHNYNRWKTMHIPNDFYISTLCKKLIIPLYNRIEIGNGEGDGRGTQNAFPFDSLIYDPPVTGAGMLSGVPKAGYMIATIDIGDTSGWYDADGQSWNEIRDTALGGAIPPAPPATCPNLGKVNLKSGVQSVVGKILAVRPIKHQTTDTYNSVAVIADPLEVVFDAFEIYVYDFFNPGLKNKMVSTTGAIGNFQKANTEAERTGGPIAIPDLNTTVLNLRKQVHGAAEFRDGYSFNPAFNHINGPPYQPKSAWAYDFQGAGNAGDYISPDGLPGGNCCRPTWNTMYAGNDPLPDGPGPIGVDLLAADGESIYDEGSDETAQNTSQYDYGYGKDMGLSFLWSGCECGFLRYPPYITPRGGHTQGEIRQYISNTISEMGYNGANLTHSLRIIPRCVFSADTVFNYYWNVGAMICCKPETMMAIINGEHDTVAGVDGNPRYWFPWTYQMGESRYSERHYANNGYNSDDAAATFVSDPDTGGSGITRINDENRRDVGFVGIPWNINWRQAYATTRLCDQTRGDTVGTFGSGAIPNATPDFMPRYCSTPTGRAPGSAVNAAGGPYVWGGYNNCISSVHFQTPDCGDTELCRTSRVITINNTAPILLGATQADFGNYLFATNEIADNDRIFVQIPNALGAWCDVNGAPVVIPPGPGAGGTRVTFNKATLLLIPDDSKFMFTNKGNYAGCGIDAYSWSSDMLCLKEYTMKLGVDTGFYTPTLLADKINSQLHESVVDYAKNRGTLNVGTNEYDVPTSVGLGERALPSVPSVINSCMLQTTIPDISYGFLPVTRENSAQLNQTASTTEFTDILTYDSYNATLGTYTFYYWWDLPLQQITDNLKVYSVMNSNTDIGFTTPCGIHTKFYSIPYLPKEHHLKGDDLQLHLLRLKGGALRKDDFDTTATPPVWENQKSRFVGYETLRSACYSNTQNGYGGGSQAYFPDSAAAYWWRTRYVRNMFPNGGSCRVFAGANNPTISFNEGENRISLTNLYTPFRPHESENGKKTDFDVGDALPSAIIDSRKSGAITDSLCGTYINNLVGDAINEDNWGTFPCGNILYDTETDADIVAKGQGFCDKLGYSATFVSANNNDFSVVTTPYSFIDRHHIYGNTIRNLALVDSSVNATNPMVSNCLMINPVRQFMVEVNSDEIFGDSNPELGNDPFYLIGSDFPAKEFYGSTDGTKLPVIGICSRNFSSFNFVFDLGGSSITFTINEKRTIKSIRTKIFTSKMGTPNNLSKYSSVIYLVTKSNYINKLNPQEEQESLQQIQANRNAQLIGSFYNPSEASHRTEPPAYPLVIPQSYYESEGSYVPTTEDENTGEDSDLDW